MVIYFICRGNVFRSIIAEAYLKSLNIPNVTVASGGTVAAIYKEANASVYPIIRELLTKHGVEKYMKDHYGDEVDQTLLKTSDKVICLNKIVYDELQASFEVPKKTYVWDVADIGEVGYVIETEEGQNVYMEKVYEQIVKNVDSLVSAWDRQDKI